MGDVKLNDWVYSESPGIWRVYRVIRDVRRFRFNRQERQKISKQPLIFVKRLVDRSWNAAYSNEVATETFARALSESDRQRLDEWIRKNPDLVKSFEAFDTAPMNLAVNLALYVPDQCEKEHLQRLIGEVFADIAEGLTNDTIRERIAAGDLAGYTPRNVRNATLQFISKDHEVRNNEYVFREVQLLMA
jgi:hypothetical protein